MYDRVNRIWTVETGDTLSKISQFVYNDYRKYPRIQQANSGLVTDPDFILPNWKLYIPEPEGATKKFTSVEKSDDQSILIRIGGKDLQIVSDFQISEGINQGARTCSFLIPFNVNDGFKVRDKVQVFLNGKLYLDGILLIPEVTYSKDNGNYINWQASTKVNDILKSQFKTKADRPASWKNISLKDLVDNVLIDYDIDVQFSDQSIANQTYKKIGIGSESIFDFLAKIANQKGFLLQGLATGDLFFSKAEERGVPVGSFTNQNLITVTCDYSGLCGEYRALNQKTKGGGAKSATNDFFPTNLFRQVEKDVGFDGDLQSFVDFYQSREFANALKVTIKAEDFKSPEGVEWASKQFVTVNSPENGIDRDLLMVIDSVTFPVNRSGKFPILNCVLPETRTGKMPNWLPFL